LFPENARFNLPGTKSAVLALTSSNHRRRALKPDYKRRGAMGVHQQKHTHKSEPMKAKIFAQESFSLAIAAGWIVIVLFASMGTTQTSRAATIWNGPPVSESDATAPDKITDNVWLTRGGSQGLYNVAQESGFTHFLSPADTEWADGTTADLGSIESFTDWNIW
jgi:hypothetical protein